MDHFVKAKVRSAMPLLRSLYLCFVALVIAGCAVNVTHGTEISGAKLDALKIGTTTKDEVVSAFGKPGATRLLPDGRTLMVYVFSRSRINPPSIETLTGMKPVSEPTGVQFTSFVFDSQNRLTSYAGEHNSPTAETAPAASPASGAAL
jgi:hypothetical protein